MNRTAVLFNRVTKSFNKVEVLKNCPLEFPDKGLVSLLGKSGCGKTTILNLIAGLIKPNQGEILGIKDKIISISFQDERLLPWCTVLENVAVVINDKLNKSKKAKEILQKVELGEFLTKKPHELSGGMRQRVVLARALAYESEILLLDEPFNGLDENTKGKIVKIIDEQKKKKLVILVTHNVNDAIKLSDIIYVLKNKPIDSVEKITVDLKELDRHNKNEQFIVLANKLSLLLA